MRWYAARQPARGGAGQSLASRAGRTMVAMKLGKQSYEILWNCCVNSAHDEQQEPGELDISTSDGLLLDQHAELGSVFSRADRSSSIFATSARISLRIP